MEKALDNQIGGSHYKNMAKLRSVKYVIFMRKNFSILGEN